MAKLSILAGATSETVDVFIQDSSKTNGAGLTGLVFNSGSLIAYYNTRRGSSTSITLATLAAANSAWSSGGFKEIDATNQPGHYRFDIPNAVIASANGRYAKVVLRGAANMADVALEIELTGIDNQNANNAGLAVLPASAIPGAANGVFIAGTNAATVITTSLTTHFVGTVDTLTTYTGNTLQTADVAARTPAALTANGNMKSSLVEILTTTLTETSGYLAAAFKKFFNIAVPTLTSGGTDQTGDNFTRLGAPVAGSHSADVANVQTRANTISSSQLPAALQGGRMDSSIGAYQTGMHVSLPKNVANAGFQFLMIDASDHYSRKIGLTVTATVSIDGGAFVASTNAPTELGNGWYTIDMAAADLNGNNIAWNFAAAGADPAGLTVRTQP